MAEAILEGEKARLHAPPNPWVGALVVVDGHVVASGHTQVPGESHAEVEALRHAGERARGATMVVTLEPCCHVGRTGPCVDAIIEAGITRVVVGVARPRPSRGGTWGERDCVPRVSTWKWASRSRRCARSWRRTSGTGSRGDPTWCSRSPRPSTASSRWPTDRASGSLARRRDATRTCCVRRARPSWSGRIPCDLTIRRSPRAWTTSPWSRCAWSWVTRPRARRVHPCWERQGELGAVLDELGEHDILQVLVEGGATVASAFLEAGLVNHVVWYVAPALAGSAARSRCAGAIVDAEHGVTAPGAFQPTCAASERMYEWIWRSDGVVEHRRGGRTVAPRRHGRRGGRRGPRERGRPDHGGRGRDGGVDGVLPRVHLGRLLRAPGGGRAPTSSICRSWSSPIPRPSAPRSRSPSIIATAPRRAFRRAIAPPRCAR